jgi:hypothetical protein
MALFPVTDSQAGPRITLNEFLNQPLLIQEAVLQVLNRQLMVDAVLRNAGTTQSGVIKYRESSPLFADTDAQTRAEFAEVPIAETSEGEPRVATVEERALAVVISDEMVRRQQVDMLQRQLLRVQNTMRRSWDRTFFDMIVDHPNVQRLVITNPWSNPTTGKPRIDLLEAIRLVEEAAPVGYTDAEWDFTPDTLIIGRGTKADLFTNEEFNKVYNSAGDAARENLMYTGTLPRQVYGLDVLVSATRVPAGKAIVMQRNVAGFIADELPLNVTPLYRKEENKMSRADVQRASGMGLDQPKAVVILEGVE